MKDTKSQAWARKLCAASLLAVLLAAVSPTQAYGHTGGNHKRITREAAMGEGYSDHAIAELVEANLKVDSYKSTQPGTPDNPGANAHGMRSPGQSEENARAGAEEFKNAKVDHAVNELLAGNFTKALEQLGHGTHTVQDELQHRFGVWRGLWSWWNIFTGPAIWFYGSLAVHGVRDVWLGDEEKQENVDATRRYLQEFEERFEEECSGSGRAQEVCHELLTRIKDGGNNTAVKPRAKMSPLITSEVSS